MPNTNNIAYSQSISAIIDAMQLGATKPVYTWRKGGVEDNYDENGNDLDTNRSHLYLSIAAATDKLSIADVLIEIDPETHYIKFHGKTELLNDVDISALNISGNSLSDGTIPASKLEKDIVIDGSVKKLTEKRSINGIEFDGTADVINFGHCKTAGDNPSKTVTIDNYQEIEGGQVTIHLKNSNTAANPTLSINDLDPCPIWYNGSSIEPSKLVANHYYTMIFDGVHYVVTGDLNEVDSDENVIFDQVDDDVDYNLAVVNNDPSSANHGNYTNTITVNPSNGKLTVGNIVSNISGNWSAINNQTAGIINSTADGKLVGLSTYKGTDGVYSLTGTPNGLVVTFTSNQDIEQNADKPTSTITLIGSDGTAKFDTITADQFNGNATSATQAINDGNGNNIAETYATVADVSTKYLPLTGGQLTGKLYLISTDVNDLATTAVSKDYVDGLVVGLRSDILGGESDAGGGLNKRIDDTNETVSQLSNSITLVSNNLSSNYYTKSEIDQKQQDVNESIANTNSSLTTFQQTVADTYSTNESVQNSINQLSNTIDNKLSSIKTNIDVYFGVEPPEDPDQYQFWVDTDAESSSGSGSSISDEQLNDQINQIVDSKVENLSTSLTDLQTNVSNISNKFDNYYTSTTVDDKIAEVVDSLNETDTDFEALEAKVAELEQKLANYLPLTGGAVSGEVTVPSLNISDS